MAKENNNLGSNIKVHKDHLWFYDEINDVSALNFNKILTELGTQHAQNSVNGMFEPVAPNPIWLHINSQGGIITSAMSMVDTINRISNIVPIITIVEGLAASAGTFLSIVGTKRVIREHSYMLLHQLSGANWGKYEEMKDDFSNSEQFMKHIQRLYKKYTKIPQAELKEILKRDLYFDAKKCLKLGLVDQIII